MTSYFRSWLWTGTSRPADALPVPSILEISPPPSDDEDQADDDTPPPFPSLPSAQRVASGIPRILTDSELMPPPPPPYLESRQPGVVAPAASTLGVPSTTAKPFKHRGKVALAPGHGALDWASLKSSGEDLRGVDTLLRIPPSILKTHNTRGDAWTAIDGKVYNITPYLSYHPGGEKELMRAAGRDGTKLFTLTHSWVNAGFLLDACMVGFLVPER